MRHHYKGRKLGTSTAHTKAMKRSLTAALLYNDRIKTIESRAKEIRPEVDRIITWAKKGDLHSRRLAIARLGGDKELVREVFEKVSQGMFADRQGGYTRIMKLGPRKGDGAPMVIIELCTEPVAKKKAKTTDAAKPKKAAAKPKKAEKVEEVAEEPVTDSADETLEEKFEEVIEEKESKETPVDEAEASEEAEEVVEEQDKAEEAEAANEEVAEEEKEVEAEANREE